jgi:hypothetical protein
VDRCVRADMGAEVMRLAQGHPPRIVVEGREQVLVRNHPAPAQNDHLGVGMGDRRRGSDLASATG